MIILKMWGGLGNQMFIYALYKSMLEKKKNVKIDMSYFENFNAHNGYELKNVFGIDVDLATKRESEQLANIGISFQDKLRRLFFKPKQQFIPKPEEAIKFFPEIFSMENVYLQGYWQREEYFSCVKDKIAKDFSFKKEMNADTLYFKEKIERTNSVSLHVRRGDYISHKTFLDKITCLILNRKNRLDGVCTKKYYENAMKYVESRIKNPLYFIFSNDMLWCKRHFNIKNVEFVDCNNERNGYQDMYLMSLCQHNIIANSSFSWWGAWLNKNNSKVVVNPKKWFNSSYNVHCGLDDWVKISTS